MISKSKKLILATITSLLLFGGFSVALTPLVFAAPAPEPAATTTSATTNSAADQVCQGLSQADGSTGCDSKGTGKTATSLINTIINLFSWAIGVIAVIMIIFGGFKFVASTGDSGKVASARSTIIYALIGLVVVALAQTIVKFVLGQFIK